MTNGKNLIAEGTLMPSASIMYSLNVIFQILSTCKAETTIFATKWGNFRMNSGAVSVQVWFLMERMATNITNVGLFLYVIKKYVRKINKRKG